MEPQVAGGGEVVAPARTVTHYELLEKLGEGGMGSVFKARDTRLERLVALKFPLPRLLDSPDLRTRFMREGRALSSLSHPNIATVFEVDEAGGTPFLALEYLPGGTLRGRVRAAAGSGLHIPFGEIVDWSVGIADGLAHAHRHGIVHRDVKSGNVMFGAEGRVKLTDFGLAKVTGGGEHSTSGMVVGTFAYMSPEQASGGVVDQRSDLYSLGVVMYEAATGRMPFEGDSPAVVYQILNKEPAPPSHLRPELPPEFDRVVLKLLDKAPARRYQRGEELVRDLRALPGAGEKSVFRAATVTLRQPLRGPWTRRRWIQASAVAGLTAAGAYTGAGVVQRWLRWSALPERKHLAVLPFQTVGGDERLQALADGLMVTLTRALVRIRGLLVVAADSAMTLESGAQARDQFGANLVLAGTVVDLRDRLRVTLQLADAETARDFGSARLEAPRTRLPAIPAEALAKVAGLLHLAVPPGQQTTPETRESLVPGAQQAYTQGEGYLYRYDRKDNLDRALVQFDEAIKLDSKFAAAYAGLAETHLRIHNNKREPEGLQSALLAANRAVELDRESAYAHRTRGAVLTALNQPDDAVQELETALKLDVSDQGTYLELGSLLETRRQYPQAEVAYQQAVEAAPGDWRSHLYLAIFYVRRQREADAEREFKTATELTAENHIPFLNRATALYRLGRVDEAIQDLRTSLNLREGARANSNLGAILMFEGRYPEALDAMEKAAKIATRDGLKSYRLWGNLGDAYWLNSTNPEKKVEAWRKAIEVGETQLRGSEADAELLSQLAKYHAKLGEKTESEALITRALQYAPDSATVHYQASLVHALFEEKEAALAEVRLAVARGYNAEEIRKAPELNVLRSDPRFEDILTSSSRR